MSDRLAADKDFQSFVIFSISLTTKIKETKSAKLFDSYVRNTANNNDAEAFVNSIGYVSKNSFNAALINNYKLKVRLNEKFSELKEFEKNAEAIRLAVNTVASEKLKPQTTTEQCWDAYFALTSIWSAYCLGVEDWSACILQSYSAISLFTIGCLLIAD